MSRLRFSLLLVLIGLILVFIGIGYFIIRKSSNVLPIGTRAALRKNVGINIFDYNPKQKVEGIVGEEELVDIGARSGQWTQPVTVFATNEEQRIDGSIFSRGYDRDGIERVLIRGKFGKWYEQTLLARTLGRRSFGVESAGKEFQVYVGKSVKMLCQAKTFYDKDGKPHDLTRAYVDYDTMLDENGRTVYFGVGMGQVSASVPTQLPVVFVNGDIPNSGLADANRQVISPKWHDVYNYLIKRFSAMDPGQAVVVNFSESNDSGKELMAALQGKDVDGISNLGNKPFLNAGVFWFPDDGTRP